MHAIEACEIPMLRSPSASLWPSTSSMRGVWKDMDSSAQEAGSSRPPKLSSSSASRPRQGLHAGPALLSSHHRGATGLSVSIPSGSATMVARPQPQKIPGGPLVLLTDGLWFEFEGIPWVLYLVALKPCRGHQATFLDPLLLPGREGASRWQQAVEAIPSPARKRVRAIVADNLPGIEKIAHQHRWVLQLCHFHLLLKLQAPRRRVRYALRGGAVREEIYQSIRNALLLPNGRRLAQTLE